VTRRRPADRPSVDGGHGPDGGVEVIELARPPAPVASVVVLAWRQVELLDRCLRSLAGHRTGVPFETVLVLNGAAPEVRAFVASSVRGAVVVDSPVNLGFAAGNHHGASMARGEHLVLLNDDAEVLDGWLDHLVAAASDPDVGAVSSCVLFPDRTVQEAGGIIWRDGTTAVMHRGRQPEDALRDGRRTVDYGSGCSLLVRRSAWEEVGGLDEGYAPAYYEDVDLCLALRHAGRRVVLEPRSMVVHHESASSSSGFKEFLFRRNHARLVERWGPQLVDQPDPGALGPDPIARASQLLGTGADRRHVLVIDDQAPRPSGGSGYARMLETILELRDLPNVRLTFGPGALRVPEDEVALAARGVRVVVEPLEEHLADPAVQYDLVLISRPNNMERYLDLVRAHHPGALVIYDTEALYHRRVALEAALEDDPVRRAAIERNGLRFEGIERRIAREADHVISLSTDEAAWLRAVPGAKAVSYVVPLARRWPLGPAGFGERSGAVFVAGWLAGADSPNGDGLRWLHGEVLPEVRRLAPGVQIGVTGGQPPPSVAALARPGLDLIGHVEDLAELYGAARVAVAPVRYGAGVKIKVIEALQHGVPVVTTTVGAEGLPPDLRDLVAVSDDPVVTADLLVELCTDRRAWARRRLRIEAAARRWSTSPRPSVGSIVGDLLDQHTAPHPSGDRAAASVSR
jgi:O-antigen biosynthesis protein